MLSALGETLKNAGPLVVGVVGIVATYLASGRAAKTAQRAALRLEKREAYTTFLTALVELGVAHDRRQQCPQNVELEADYQARLLAYGHALNRVSLLLDEWSRYRGLMHGVDRVSKEAAPRAISILRADIRRTR